jgi:hypothetical protein
VTVAHVIKTLTTGSRETRWLPPNLTKSERDFKRMRRIKTISPSIKVEAFPIILGLLLHPSFSMTY